LTAGREEKLIYRDEGVKEKRAVDVRAAFVASAVRLEADA
jgi:hypothetical protein